VDTTETDTPPEIDWGARAIAAGRVFTPAAPIDDASLFAGRTPQVRKVVDAVNQRGQHAIIYGERGVGKTSLANVIPKNVSVAGGGLIMPHINADTGDTYSSLWRKVVMQIALYDLKFKPGFDDSDAVWHPKDIGKDLPDNLTTGDIRRLLTPLGNHFVTVIIIDEFDRLPTGQVRTMMADTIKMLADHTRGITLVLVGVAENVGALIAEHQSLHRNLIQVPLPRMSTPELEQIINNGLKALAMTMDEGARLWITSLSRGLPHYTHLLARFAVRTSIDSHRLNVSSSDVAAGIAEAVGDAQQTISDAYHEATSSPRRDALYRQVLLACALARTDEMGFFTPAEVRRHLNAVAPREKVYEFSSFSNHLKEFCGPERGAIFEKRGISHRPRYRFKDAMLQPYVLLKAFADHMLTKEMLSAGR
jgi:Cdc6-like AAA superfamily ATPase